ncbi:EAL domain-containing protein [Thiohalospira halophila DSM 15071]|uniref:EAL domain-containing protein n=1 Tax=Thiohalospira halophila DSM 15071 TaxID=1123397 RepID=A0A1I1N7C5_9GAMM|nr:EAL domain-containing protein [Thiohalospira halophila]SFC90703.1 EAL domain-containing protein [Thiohalospira halophila DSM 15071]
MSEHRDGGQGLLYQVEPIQGLGDLEAATSTPDPQDLRLGQELLYRGQGRYPDEALIKALGQAHLRLDGTLHINLDAARAMAISDELIQRAAERHSLVVEWVAAEQSTSSRMTSLIGSRMDAWRRFGVRIAIDDWDDSAEGDARYHAVDNAPDIVKVDGPLFRQALEGDREKRRRLITFLDRVRQEGEEILRVAEWVEQATELEVALAMGANAAQGYAFRSARIWIPENRNQESRNGSEE